MKKLQFPALSKRLTATVALFCIGIIILFFVITFVLACPSLLYVTVAFDTDHGTAIDSFEIKIGTAPEIPETVRKYNTFHGWYLDEERTVPYRGEKIYKNTTLYAKWDTIFTNEFLGEYAQNLQKYYDPFMMTFFVCDIGADAVFSDPEIISCYPGLKVFVLAAGTYDGISTELAIGLIFPTLEMSDAFYEKIYPRYSYQFDKGNSTLFRKDVLILVVAEGNQATFLGTVYETEDFVFAINEEGTEASIVRYQKDDETVVVPSEFSGLPVTAIGAFAFAEKSLSAVTLSNNMKTVGKFAFLNCRNLSYLALPDNIAMLGNGFISRSGITLPENINVGGSDSYQIADNALYDNVHNRLLRYLGTDTDYIIRQGTQIIDACAFEGAHELENVVFPEGLLIIEPLAFFECFSLKEAVFPQSIRNIGYSSFSCSAENQPSALRTVRFAPGCHMEEISDNAFAKNALLESVILPDAIESPGNYIFEDCINLKQATLPQNLTEITTGMFKGCSSLQTIVKSAPIRIIDDEAFRDCVSLTEFDFSDAVHIGRSAFENCVSLTAIEFSDCLETCDFSAFSGCSSIEILVLPSTLKELGLLFVSGMSKLKEITLPLLPNYNRMQFLLGNLISGNLKKITINNPITVVPDYFFENLTSVTEIVLPYGIRTIGQGAFMQCTMLSEIHLPDTIRYLGNTAFYRCPSLTAISLPEGLTEIDRWCFAECSSLASIELPSTLKRLGGGAFRDCVLLEKAYLPDAMDYVGEGVFAGCFGIREFRVPLSDDESIYPRTISSYTENYTGNYVSNVEKVIVSPGTVVIPWHAFEGMEKLQEIIFPSTITRFEQGALAFIPNIKKLDISCTDNYGKGILEGSFSLEELTLNLSDNPSDDEPGYFGYFFVGYGDRNSGYENYNIKKITVVSNNQSLGASAFVGAKGLTDIVLPPTLTEISETMFSGCAALKNIVIPSEVTVIEKKAFQNCVALEEITLPGKLNTIQSFAFSHCESLRTVHIPEDSELYSLGDNIFEYCVSLEDISFRDYTIWKIPYSTFYGCSSLKDINLPEGLQEIGNNAFSNSGLVSIKIPVRVTTIGWYAFSDCADLRTLEFENIEYSMISEIGAYAFIRCTSLERIVFPKSLLVVGIMAFNDCSSLREVYVLREYDYRKSWQTAATRLEINNGPATFEGCHPDIVFYVPKRNGNVETDGQYGEGSVAGVTAYKIYALGWDVYADRIQEIPADFQI